MTTGRRDSRLCTLIDTIYRRQAPNHDPLALMPEWFHALRPVLPFSSGVFIPIDPVGGRLWSAFPHDCDQRAKCDDLGHYQKMDPCLIWQPALRNPDTVVRLSYVANIDRTMHGESGEFGKFGESISRTPHIHALAVIPQLGDVPLGAFAVHRHRRMRDFNPHEMLLFQWFAGHAATAIDYLTLQRQREQRHRLAVMVMSRDGSIQALSPEAMHILESLPDNAVQVLPGPGESSRIWRCGSDVVVASTRRVDPARIIGLGHANRLPASPAIGCLAQRLKIADSEQRQQFSVTLEILDVNNEVRGEVFGLQLTPQQKRVAVLLLKRYEPRQIADILLLSPHTVREYVKAIYCRAGVHGYAKLISRLSGASGATPLPSRASS